MESNAVKVRFFHKSGRLITRGLQERQYEFALPSNIRDRSELKEGSVVAVTNRNGYTEAAVIVAFLTTKRISDLKQVIGNYHSDYYDRLEGGEA